VDLYILMSLLETAGLLRPHTLCVQALMPTVPLSTTETWDTQVELNTEEHHMGLQWSVTEKVHWKQFAKKSLGNHLDGYFKLKKEEMPL